MQFVGCIISVAIGLAIVNGIDISDDIESSGDYDYFEGNISEITNASRMLEEQYLIDLDEHFYDDEDYGETVILNATTISSVKPGISNNVQNVLNIPADCSSYMKLSTQPTYNGDARIKKCCPIGQNLQMTEDGKRECMNETRRFYVEVIVASMHIYCIEDEGKIIMLAMQAGNPCVGMETLVYNANYNDTLYILQNGSLLRVNSVVGTGDYKIYDEYCVDVDDDEKILTAFVCGNEFLSENQMIYRGQIFVLAFCIITAVPLLIVTAVIYLIVPQFNDTHGKSLACNCICFAMALVSNSLFRMAGTSFLGKCVDYFVLTTFFWLTISCFNNCFHAWHFLPKGIKINRKGEAKMFTIYSLISLLIPLIIILITNQWDSSQTVKHYFFIPIMITIVINALLFMATFVGFHEVNAIVEQRCIVQKRIEDNGTVYAEVEKQIPNILIEDVDKVKNMTIYTAFLFTVMTLVWIMTIITYYTTFEISILFEILFSLQGVLIFLIFVCLPLPLTTLKAWWRERRYIHQGKEQSKSQKSENSPLKYTDTTQ